MWFAYIHYWETDVLFMGSPRDCISGTEPNQMSRRTRTERVFGSQG
jgi:hypothetical protein